MPQSVFIDTEFIETPHGPRFISVALLPQSGAELYSEVSNDEAESLLKAFPNQFVREHVVSQLGRWPAVPWAELPGALAAWLDALGEEAVDVIYDYSSDFLLLEQLLQSCPERLKTRLHPVHVGYLLDDEDGKRAAAATWNAVEHVWGLSRHHALADGFALRARFETVHPPVPPPRNPRTIEVLVTVSVVISEFELVHAESDDGQLTISIGKRTSGVDWRSLTPGQRLRCVVHLDPTRTLSAELLSPSDPMGDFDNDK
ncbi:MAG: hypothetical protein GXC94_13175 [Comamonadaceae bacterium]|nr:hypothetical protein [Comamonadaceae bacterium]